MKHLAEPKLLLKIVCVAAFIIRIGAMVALESYKFPNDESFGFGYGETAKHVALGEGFSLGYYDSGAPRATAVAPPGYVYFIAVIFLMFGIYSAQSAIVIEMLQIVMAAATCIVFYHLGKRFSEGVGLLAASAIAFYPASILFSVGRISPSVLTVLVTGLVMLYVFKIQERWQPRDALVCGGLMGVNALFEPTVILFYIAMCAWLIYWDTARIRAVKCSLIMGVLCTLFILPWTIRNYVVFNAFVPIKSSIGRHLLEGSHPFGDGIVFGDNFDRVFSSDEQRRLQNLNEIEEDRAMRQKALEFIKADPKEFVTRTLKRVYYYWAFVNPYRPTNHDLLRIITYGPAFILALIGTIFFARRNWREVSLFLALFISYPLFYYVTQVTINRYRYGVEAFLLIMASYAAVELVSSLGVYRSARMLRQADSRPG